MIGVVKGDTRSLDYASYKDSFRVFSSIEGYWARRVPGVDLISKRLGLQIGLRVCGPECRVWGVGGFGP